jgi:threonine dehydrogenase-like Zn-dependent dehydrogenase
MAVEDWPELVPGRGQVLVDVVACGICGSDLHAVRYGAEMAEAARSAGTGGFDFDPSEGLVMGHELAVRVLEVGEGVDARGAADGGDGGGAGARHRPAIRPGLEAAAMPVLTLPGGFATVGYDHRYPGGYAERILVSPGGLRPVPNGLPAPLAALTEPLAVGLHAVNESSIDRGRSAVVLGCGPVGLAVIAALSTVGAEPIVAADFSPRRRQLAAQLGAHVVVDPAAEQAFDAWRTHADRRRPPVAFEAVGVRGMIGSAMEAAPDRTELVVVGGCMQDDRIRPILGIYKHLVIRFVLGWTPTEFDASLANLAEGRIDGAAFVTGEVDLAGVPGAFAELARPDRHVKVLVRP